MALNRRSFVVSGASLGVGGLLASASTRAGATAPLEPASHSAVAAVVVDARIRACRAIGEATAALGLPTHPVAGDLTELWRDRLAPLWAREPATIAGCGTPRLAFCMEQLARDHRLRPSVRIVHQPLADGRVRHGLSGEGAMTRYAQAIFKERSDWRDAMAFLLAARPPSQAQRREEADVIVGGADAEPIEETLVSWISAHPMGRAPAAAV